MWMYWEVAGGGGDVRLHQSVGCDAVVVAGDFVSVGE